MDGESSAARAQDGDDAFAEAVTARRAPALRVRAGLVTAGVTVLVGGVVLVSTTRDDDAHRAATAPTLITDLCELRATNASENIDAIRARFFDRVHEPLHQLARQLGTDHRAQAARLLQAKQVVESKLAQGQRPDAGQDVDPLITETATGLSLLDFGAPATCARGTSR